MVATLGGLVLRVSDVVFRVVVGLLVVPTMRLLMRLLRPWRRVSEMPETSPVVLVDFEAWRVNEVPAGRVSSETGLT
jgi:hypothetical protein